MRNVTGACLCVLAAGSLAGIGIRTGHRDRNGRHVGGGVIKESPAQARARLKKEYNSALTNARRELEGRNWGQARLYLKLAEGAMIDKSQAPPIAALYQKLEKEGRKLLRQAEEKYTRKEYAEALVQYQRIVMAFGRLPCARAARDAVAAAEKNPEIQEVLQEAKAQVLGETIEKIIARADAAEPPAATGPDKVKGKGPKPKGRPPRPSRVERIRKLNAENQIRVMDLLEKLAKLYPITPTGRRAGEDLQELQSDEEFRLALSQRRLAVKAGAALRRARTYEQAGMGDKAVEYYEQVVRDYPDTPEAREAQSRIDILRAGTGGG